MSKQLKFWNGRPHGKYLRNDNYKSASFYVAAYSMAEAARIISKVADTRINSDEIRDYYNEGGWGNKMELPERDANEPCLYIGWGIGNYERIDIEPTAEPTSAVIQNIELTTDQLKAVSLLDDCLRLIANRIEEIDPQQCEFAQDDVIRRFEQDYPGITKYRFS